MHLRIIVLLLQKFPTSRAHYKNAKVPWWLSGLSIVPVCSPVLFHAGRLTCDNKSKSHVKAMLCPRCLSEQPWQRNRDTVPQIFISLLSVDRLCVMSMSSADTTHFHIICIPSGGENMKGLLLTESIDNKCFSFTRPFCLSLSVVKTLPKTVWHRLPKLHYQVRTW